jgi:hypothetical protein
MITSPKARILLLLVAALFTTMALMLPEPTQACPTGDVYECHYPNGVRCIEPECGQPTCNGTPWGTPTCYYIRTECCRP